LLYELLMPFQHSGAGLICTARFASGRQARRLSLRELSSECAFLFADMGQRGLKDGKPFIHLVISHDQRDERPEDVANVIGFLVSPRSDYMTGQALSIDGGLVMHG